MLFFFIPDCSYIQEKVISMNSLFGCRHYLYKCTTMYGSHIIHVKKKCQKCSSFLRIKKKKEMQFLLHWKCRWSHFYYSQPRKKKYDYLSCMGKEFNLESCANKNQLNRKLNFNVQNISLIRNACVDEWFIPKFLLFRRWVI